MKTTRDIMLLSPDGKEELGIIPGAFVDLYLAQKGVKSRSAKAIREAGLAIISEALDSILRDRKKTKKKTAKNKTKKSPLSLKEVLKSLPANGLSLSKNDIREMAKNVAKKKS